MKEKNKYRDEKKNIKEVVLPVIIFVTIVIIVAFVLINESNDKSYEIEEIKNFSYFKLYENKKYGIIDSKGNVIIPTIYEMIEIPNPSKAVFIGYLNYELKDSKYETEVINDKNEKILKEYSRRTGSFI